MPKWKDIDDKLLEKRAKGVVTVVYYATEQFLKHIAGKTKGLKGIQELKEISEKEKDLIALLTSISFLFQAQKFFWENIIEDEKLASKFEETIYDWFKKTARVNPKPYVKDIGEYIKKQGSRGEVMYLGSKICRELGKPSAFLMLELNMIFSEMLTHGFFESLKRAWEIES